jgi:hypothetical protein
VPRATVIAVNTTTMQFGTALTDANGVYVITNYNATGTTAVTPLVGGAHRVTAADNINDGAKKAVAAVAGK